MSTLDNWSVIARSHSDADDPDGFMRIESVVFFMSLVLVVSFTLLPVVVAVLLGNPPSLRK